MQQRTEPRRSSLELETSSLGILSPTVPLPQKGEKVEELPMDSIKPNARQVRTRFDEGRIAELAESITAHGLLQPLVVRRIPKSPNVGLLASEPLFELVAGERRFRALK